MELTWGEGRVLHMFSFSSENPKLVAGIRRRGESPFLHFFLPFRERLPLSGAWPALSDPQNSPSHQPDPSPQRGGVGLGMGVGRLDNLEFAKIAEGLYHCHYLVSPVPRSLVPWLDVVQD